MAVLSSPLATSANNIVSIGNRSNRALAKSQSEFNQFVNFLEIKKFEIERIKLPDEKKIKQLSNINIVNTFGSAGGLLGSLLSGALDLGGLIRGFFPGKGEKVGSSPKSKITGGKPSVKGGRIRLGGIRALGIANAVFAGLDFATGLQEGEGIGKAAAGAGGSLAGSLLGGAIGQALIPVPGLGFVLGSMAGGFLGGYAADRVMGSMSGTSIKEKAEQKIKEQEIKQKISAQSTTGFDQVVARFDLAVGKFEKGVASGLFGTVRQVNIMEDVATEDYAETEDYSQDQDVDQSDYGSMGGTFESHIKEFREFRNKQFGAPKGRNATANPQLYQIRELGIWEGGKEDNWKINPLADDTAYEKNVHEGAGHWQNRAFDIPVPDSSKQGDIVAEFWRKKGYTVIWRSKGHYDHVHVEVPREKANDFFAGKLKPETQKANISTDADMMQGKVNVNREELKSNKTQQPVKSQDQTITAPTPTPTPTLPISQNIIPSPPKESANIQAYPSYSQGQSYIIDRPMIISSGGGGGRSQKPILIPTGGGGTQSVIISGPSEGQVVNSLVKSILLTNLSSA